MGHFPLSPVIVWEFQVSTFCQYLVVSIFVLTNPLGLSWYLSVFICSSFIADDIEHFLLCLRIICTTSFAHFKTLFYFVLWLIYTDSLCVLIMISFSDVECMYVCVWVYVRHLWLIYSFSTVFSSGSFMALAFTLMSMIHKALEKTKENILGGWYAVLFRLDTKALTVFKQSASLDLIKI